MMMRNSLDRLASSCWMAPQAIILPMASFHISCWPVASHSRRICFMDSRVSSPQWLQCAFSSCPGILFQCSPTLYPSWISIHRKYLTLLEKSRCLVAIHTWASVAAPFGSGSLIMVSSCAVSMLRFVAFRSIDCVIAFSFAPGRISDLSTHVSMMSAFSFCRPASASLSAASFPWTPVCPFTHLGRTLCLPTS
ncbi:unnamed protein product [Mycena citricolor]|uniref:Uncharacterized protein n=1 Tax=Mycena citricolor TaxID=2018698 RepID=A0AAD2HS79_9AGAR|nr:unnamed protein product [Mycena citricolor]